MKIGLVANPEKTAAVAIAEHVASYLSAQSELVIADSVPRSAALDGPRAPLEDLGADAIVAIGGDGTFLSALSRTASPILALNAGTVGVLAEVDARDYAAVDAALERLVRGFYFIDDRMKLALQAGREIVPDATNEAVVHCRRAARMGHFEIALDGRPLGRIRADGVILATPTGSTGYALSALGPIVEPGVEGIVVVAIAPFRAVARAIVVDPLHTVSVRPLSTGAPAVVVVDGQTERPIEPGGSVLAYRSPRRARFIRFGSPYLFRLRGKGILPWSDGAEGLEEEPDADVPSRA